MVIVEPILALKWRIDHPFWDLGVTTYYMHGLNVGDIGVVFSPLVNKKQVGQNGKVKRTSKKKFGYLLKHFVHILKCLSRLPINDRSMVLKILSKKCIRMKKRQAPKGTKEKLIGKTKSSNNYSFINKDWQN